MIQRVRHGVGFSRSFRTRRKTFFRFSEHFAELSKTLWESHLATSGTRVARAHFVAKSGRLIRERNIPRESYERKGKQKGRVVRSNGLVLSSPKFEQCSRAHIRKDARVYSPVDLYKRDATPSVSRSHPYRVSPTIRLMPPSRVVSRATSPWNTRALSPSHLPISPSLSLSLRLPLSRNVLSRMYRFTDNAE